MKKLKKVVAICLTAAMALSMMSVGVFAADAKCISNPMSADYICNDNTPEIGTVITYTNDEGVEKTAVITEIVELVPVNEGISLAWASKVFEDVEIPKNITGNEGVQIGGSYAASLSDNYAYVSTANWNAYLNKLNIALIDETTGTVTWGYAPSEGTYYINYRLTAGNTYHYKFSAEQSGTQTCLADIQLFSN